MIEVKHTLNGELNASIIKEYPELEEIIVTPTLEGQELEPSKYGYSKVKIKAIPATDVTIAPSEEQQNLKGIFKEVNINPIQVEEITTDLDFSSGDAIEITPQEGTYIKKTTINKPTNLSPENIKSGETVCGIAGTNADTSDADATSDDIAKGKSAYVNNEKVVGTMEVSEYNALSKTEIPSNTTTYTCLAKIITKIPDNLVMNGTNGNYLFANCNYLDNVKIDMNKATSIVQGFYDCWNLTNIELNNTNNITNWNSCFQNCTRLENLKVFDTTKTKTMTNTFRECTKLSDESLNNILMMCINATSYNDNKTLSTIGLNINQATRCQSLSNYQAFLNARLEYRLLKI